jgi:hypothetical protein
MTFLERLESLNPEQIIADLRADIAQAKSDLAAIQTDLTTLSNGYLTVTAELQLLRQALTTAGITLPATVLNVTAETH